jgi:hypothetical protein
MPTGRTPKYNWDVIRQLAATGTPLPTICQQLGVNYDTIKSRAKREGWRITEVFGRAPKTNPKQTFQLVQKSAKAIIDQNGAASRLHLSGAIRKASAHLEAMAEDKLIANHQAIQSVSKAASQVHAWTQDQEKQHRVNINLAVLATPPSKLASLASLSEAELDAKAREIDS